MTPRFPAEVDSLGDAEAAVERYLDRLGARDLYMAELMEFERNYYAIIAGEDTRIGAMELLLDKASGRVSPEPGPNMMWNLKYGMNSVGMMRDWNCCRGDSEMVLSPSEARDVAQRWLDITLPGRAAGMPDPFYGYYTLHLMKGGPIEGMLSVHGDTGDVWLHSWHGSFVQIMEHNL